MSQFFVVHPVNPQTRLIAQAVGILRQGGVIVYPTDSGYALGCMMGEKSALEKICRIRQLEDEHNFTLLCNDLSELSVYAKIDGEILGAETLASYLSMTERNARRLLARLAEHGMAEEAGEECRGAGRPRKMFRIDVQKILQ